MLQCRGENKDASKLKRKQRRSCIENKIGGFDIEESAFRWRRKKRYNVKEKMKTLHYRGENDDTRTLGKKQVIVD